MQKMNFVYTLAVILTLYTTNVEGVDLEALKTAFKDFFDNLEGVCGQPGNVPQARTTYNQCAEEATTYAVLIDCGKDAYAAYNIYLMDELTTKYQTILNIQSTFTEAILKATTDSPPEERLIPITAFGKLCMGASSIAERASASRLERS